MSEPILVGENVRKVYHTGAEEVEALRGVDLSVAAGEFVAVMGPSGSGKTTLLNCFSGLDEIDGGRVLIDGESIHELADSKRTRHRAASMGFIFQAFNLIPVFTALENVELPLLLAGVKEREARKRAIETLERVGLGPRLNHRPAELSGGEQQRVTIARALAGTPRIVWADEPTGNLDSETASAVIGLLHELNRDGLTLVLVTHDQTMAAGANRTVIMRDGSVVAETSREASLRARARGERTQEQAPAVEAPAPVGQRVVARTADGRRVVLNDAGRDGQGRLVGTTDDGRRVVLQRRRNGEHTADGQAPDEESRSPAPAPSRRRGRSK